MDILKDISLLKTGDFLVLARMISRVDTPSDKKYDLLRQLSVNSKTKVIGITGPPGAGKSTLTQALVLQMLADNPLYKIAIVAVDPSSPFNQGALLGDRIRMNQLFLDPRIYIRSLASKGSLGGLNPNILDILQVIKSADFDFVIVETVGVGQSEIEIAGLADITLVVLVPEAGDEIQTMKAGIMEIGDILIVNKADRPNAQNMVHFLTMMVHDRSRVSDTPVIAVEANTGKGVKNVVESIHLFSSTPNMEKQAWLQAKYVTDYIQKKKMKNFSQPELVSVLLEKIIQKENINLIDFGDQWLASH